MAFFYRLSAFPLTFRLAVGVGGLILLLCPSDLRAQAGYDINLKKPAAYESKTLASEKSTSTKYSVIKSFVQSTVTHYNYYFNAHQKLLDVLDKARRSHTDDLTALIPFYEYALPQTRQDSVQLDSVIYKCTAGIVLHDLRNGWIDNLYLLMAESFYYAMKFDSADRILEFLNYHFYVKEKGDYHIPIGTREESRNGQISIVNPENHSIFHEAFNRPPSRNDGLIFQIRSYTEQGKYAAASGLISLLKTDPIFPARLLPPLYEQQAYLFFSQEEWDSAAHYLKMALPNAFNTQTHARWEYLLAQLSERTNHPDAAVVWYTKAIAHNIDPRIDIYARLYRAMLTEGTSKQELPNTINALLRLAKRDRFAPFRDILFLAAARLALQEPDTTAAFGFLNQSVRWGGKGNIHNQAFLLRAELGRAREDYKLVAQSYDSLQLGDPALAARAKELSSDRVHYDKVLVSLLKVEREDSLQRIAAMTEPVRTLYIKDLLRKLLRAQGLKEDNANMGSSLGGNKDTLNLFGNSSGTGEWYFYNQNTLSQGAQDFETRWGNRPNVDNWRRQNALNTFGGNTKATPEGLDTAGGRKGGKTTVLSFASLLAPVPLTPKAMTSSNDTTARHLYLLGGLYKDVVGDNLAAVGVLEELYQRYPTYQQESTLFDLYYCWHELGNDAKANYFNDLLHKRFPDGKVVTMMKAAPNPGKDSVTVAATEKYKQIYDQFIAGNYDSALLQKKQADSLYGRNYWTPQLMYIEAVYYVHERKDTLAIHQLNDLIGQFPKDPLEPKAAKLKDVVSRRGQIELYLNNLKIVRDKIDSTTFDTATQAAAPPPPVPIASGPPNIRQARGNTFDSLQGSLTSGMGGLQPVLSPLLVSGTIHGIHSDKYFFDASSPHLVLMVMTQVANVYSTEAKNAFSRYNQDTHDRDNIGIDTVQLIPGVSILSMGPFNNVVDAVTYEIELEKTAGKDIVPWLDKTKYRFIVISPDNLAVLRQKKDLTEYSTFIGSYTQHLGIK